jgi:hypothetical protein
MEPKPGVQDASNERVVESRTREQSSATDVSARLVLAVAIAYDVSCAALGVGGYARSTYLPEAQASSVPLVAMPSFGFSPA